MDFWKNIADLEPREVAEQLLRADAVDEVWLDTFLGYLDRRRGTLSFARTLTLWNLDKSEAARLFGVSRGTLSHWFRKGIPSKRLPAIADLAATSDLLVRYIKRERIPAVVRRGIPALGGASLLELLKQGRTSELLKSSQDMFDFEAMQTRSSRRRHIDRHIGKL